MAVVKIGELVRFTKNQKGRHLLGEGWSDPEEQHCWSVSKTSIISFNLDPFPTTDIILQIRLSSFCRETHAEANEVSLEINNTSVATLISSSTPQTFSASVSQKHLSKSSLQVIRFKPAYLLSPYECGLKDIRSLGIDMEYLIIYNDMSESGNTFSDRARISEDGNGSIIKLDNSYHRLITSCRSSIYLKLCEEGILDNLFQRNLIPASMLQKNLVGDSIVLSVQTCKSVYGARFPFSMLKDCAHLWLEINSTISKSFPDLNLGLCDCHFSNFVQGLNSTPLWCDLGSITSDINAIKGGIKQFIQTLMIPLQILASGLDPVKVRSLLHLHPLGIDPFSDDVSVIPRDILSILIEAYTSDDVEISLLSLYKLLDSFDIAMRDLQWSSYRGEDALYSALSGHLLASSSDTRYSSILNTVESLGVSTFLDIGCNDGLFSILLLQLGMDGSSADIDEKALDKLYLFLRTSQMHSPALGIFSFTQYDYCESLDQPGIVLVLALTHHLSLSQGISFEQIAKRLHDLTSRYVLTEFMPFGLGGSARHPEPFPYPLPDYYSIDNFIASLKLYFFDVRRIDYARDKEHEFYSERILILCERNLI